MGRDVCIVLLSFGFREEPIRWDNGMAKIAEKFLFSSLTRKKREEGIETEIDRNTRMWNACKLI